MSRGYVITSEDLSKILCFDSDKTAFHMADISNVSVINKAVCAPDLTEAKNIVRRIEESEHKTVVDGTEINNVARLYNKFF